MFQILFDYPGAYMRLALRAYFTITLLLLAWLGGLCSAKRVKLQLYRQRLVKISHMTGWLQGWDAASTWMSLRTTPAGWLGIMMIIASLLGIICDLAVSGLVVTVDVVSRCTFNTTGSYSALSDTHPSSKIGVEGSTVLFNLITQAQRTNLANGGLDGIFRKVNTDLQFRADERDIVGQWVCGATGETATFPADASPDTVTYQMRLQGLLFNASSSYCYNGYPDNSTGHLFSWSASQGELPTEPWHVRAAVDMSESGWDAKVMKIFACHMNAPEAEWALNATRAQSAMSGWCHVVKGNIYTMSDVPNTADFATDPATAIASGLNNIIMNAGAAWNDPQGVSPLVIDDPTQGCLAPRALIPLSVIILLAIVTAATTTMAIYWIGLTVFVRRARKPCSADFILAVEQRTPNGLLSWMRQATHDPEHCITREADHAWIKSHFFGPVAGKDFTGLMHMGVKDDDCELLDDTQYLIPMKPVTTAAAVTTYSDVPLR